MSDVHIHFRDILDLEKELEISHDTLNVVYIKVNKTLQPWDVAGKKNSLIIIFSGTSGYWRLEICF